MPSWARANSCTPSSPTNVPAADSASPPAPSTASTCSPFPIPSCRAHAVSACPQTAVLPLPNTPARVISGITNANGGKQPNAKPCLPNGKQPSETPAGKPPTHRKKQHLTLPTSSPKPWQRHKTSKTGSLPPTTGKTIRPNKLPKHANVPNCAGRNAI